MEIFQLQAKDTILRFNHYDTVNAVQNFNWDPTFNEDYKRELGNSAFAGHSQTPEVSASMDFTATGATVALMKRIIKNFVASGAFTEFNGYQAGDPATADNTGLITELDFENAVADLILAKKANEIFTRSDVLTRMYLSSWSFSASTTGDASESFAFDGDVGEVFPSDRHDLVAIPLVRDQNGTNVNPARDAVNVDADYEVDTEGVPDAGAEWTLYAIDQEGERIPDTAVTTTIGPAGFTEFSVDGTTYSFREGARLSALVYRKTPGSFPTVQYATAARFIEADDIDVLLVDPAVLDIRNLVYTLGTNTMVDEGINGLTPLAFTEDMKVLRLQSASINVPVGREALRQIKKTDNGTSIYHRSASYPFTITASMNAMETDLTTWRKIVGASVTDVLSIKDFEGKEWQLVFRLWYAGKVIQAIALTDARFNGRGASVAVQGRAEINWAVTGSEVLIEGTELV